MSERLRLRGPVGLVFSAAPWVALAYLFSSLLLGVLWFGLALTVLLAGFTLSIVWLGLPVLAAGLAVLRGMANTERGRLRLAGRSAKRPYRAVWGDTFRRRLGARLGDPATWRDATLLVALWPALLAVDLVGLVVWLSLAGVVTVPLWYRYVPQTFDNGTKTHGIAFGNFPNGPHGPGHWGLFVDDIGSALLAAGVGLALLVLAGNYLLVASARAHAAITQAMLR